MRNARRSSSTRARADIDVPESLPLRGGMDSYGATAPGARALAGTTRHVLSRRLEREPRLRPRTRRIHRADRDHGRVHAGRSSGTREPRARRTQPPPGCSSSIRGSIPAWAAARALDISQFLDPEHPAIGLRRVPAERRNDGGRRRRTPRGCPGLGDPSDDRPEGPRVSTRRPNSTRPGTRSRTRGRSSSRCLDQIVADGGTPWCFGFESEYADGWPGTDFIESLVLRAGGVDVYDAWTTGEIGFTSPDVMAAGRLADDLIFEPGFVRGGPATISGRVLHGAIQPHARTRRSDRRDRSRSAGCAHRDSYMLVVRSARTAEFGSDVDVFPLPPIDPNQPTPAIATRVLRIGCWSTRPEVRAFMEFVASPEWGEIWATDPGERSSSPPTGDSTSRPTATPSTIPQIAFNAKIASAGPGRRWNQAVLRFDASDLMPVEIGAGIDGVYARSVLARDDSTGSTASAPSIRSSPTSMPSGQP